MDMVATLMPNLIAPDLVSVQAIDNRVGMINILQYVYGSDKGEAKAGKVFASPLGYQGMDPDYTSSTVTETIKEGQTKLEWTPVRKVIATSKGDSITADEDGTLSGATVGDVVTYVYDNESVPVKSPTMTLDIKSIPVTTRSRKLSAIWAFDAQYELMKEYGSDMQTMLATQAVSEIQQEIDNEITLDLYKIANSGPEIVWSKTQPVGVSQIDHYDSFRTKIIEGSNAIFGATRRVHANWLVCGLNVASVLQAIRNFEASEDTSAIGPHFIGTLPGGIKCYVNPNYDSNSFVLGYKGANLMDAGYVYAPYMPILTTGMVTLADDFAAREGWATLYGTKAVNPKIYLRGHIV